MSNFDFTKSITKGKIGLNQSETAKILGVSIGSLELWRRTGKGPKYIKMGNKESKARIIYSVFSIIEWLEST